MATKKKTKTKKPQKKKSETKLKGKKKAMYDALYTSLGNVTSAVDKTGIGRATHYYWMNKDPVYKEAVDNLEEVTHDFVYNALMKKIREGDTTSIIFYCKTKMKDKGFTEKQEIQHSGQAGTISVDDFKQAFKEHHNQKNDS